MCWERLKTPARFPDCKGKAEGNCTLFDPDHDHIQWCVEAVARGSVCNPVTKSNSNKLNKARF